MIRNYASLTFMNSHQMFLTVFLSKAIFLLSAMLIKAEFSVDCQSLLYLFSQFSIFFFLALFPQIPGSLLINRHRTSFPHVLSPNLAESHSQSLSTIFQKYYISHLLSDCYIRRQKKKKINPENFCLFGRITRVNVKDFFF